MKKRETIIDASFNPDTGEVTVTDEILGTRTINGDEGFLGTVRDQHRLLCAMRDIVKPKRSPTQKARLDEDIFVYEYILEHPQAQQKAHDYAELMDKQRQKHGFGVSKMKVARLLGWFQ